MIITTLLGLGCLAAAGCLYIIWINTNWHYDMLFYNLGGAGMAFLISTLIINHYFKRKFPEGDINAV